MNRSILIPLLSVLLSATGCGEDDAPTQTAPMTATVETVGSGGDLLHPEIERPPKSRKTKRLTVGMLAGSIPVVAGEDEAGQSITWKLGGEEALGDDEQFGLLDRTLGRPDYVSVTDELTEPSALYVKFAQDMARDVCQQILTSDESKPQAERILARLAPLSGSVSTEQLRANLRYLKLRFWGEFVPDGAEHDDHLKSLEELFQSVTGSGEGTQAGWNAVCVALLSSPVFHRY